MASTEQLNNLKFFRKTIDTLSYSQGYYGRLKRDLDNADEEQLEELAESLPNFKDSLDVILFCEQ